MCSEASLRAYPSPMAFGQQTASSPILNASLAPAAVNRIPEPAPVPLLPPDPFGDIDVSDDPFAPVNGGRGRKFDEDLPWLY